MMPSTQDASPYHVLAYYHFASLENPKQWVAIHKKFCNSLDMTGRIYISEEGINGQACAAVEDAQKYIDWMHSFPEFKGLYFKIHKYHEHVFPRMTVKYREQLVALDKKVDLKNQGKHLSPKEWSEMLENDKDHILIDVRNDYETKLGHFENSELPPCNTFREFIDYTEELKTRVNDPKKKIMMCCTGGIRCEPYSALLREKGFEHVYQLDGGIINYGLKEGSKHWLGKLFVFDDRLSVSVGEEEAPVIAACDECGVAIEDYYNCANTECNELFIACRPCLEKKMGCCSIECSQAPRVRPYHQQDPHKPFRRLHYYKTAG